MREKELRLALVCFGGVSLAVYMHGISKEVLKLVRASSALHAITDRSARAQASFFDRTDPGDPEFDTEAVYFELLREIGRKVELRVIVDIIAGASAGGINGAMLARALSHDLPMGKLRDLWLTNADVAELLDREARARWWSKWFVKPFLWVLTAAGMLERIEDREAREKLSLFIRSRWFKPPLDGLRMAELMYDAVTIMGSPRDSRTSLLPSGQQLDLFVTVTDHYGFQQLIQIHDPPLIHEREHRHVLGFTYRRWPSGEIESDFALVDAPGLAFAARATSSFPGVFPAAQIAEIDRLLTRRGVKWPGRASFIERNFQRYLQVNVDPTTTSFVDGSVLNNKPFREAILAIRGRPAFREVDRHLVYMEPDPAPSTNPVARGRPGFFAMLKGALSDIPRNEPIADELTWINSFNERVRRLKAIVEAARPQITRHVAEAVDLPLEQSFGAEEVSRWRERMNAKAAGEAGFAYEGYVRLKLAAVRAFVAQLIAGLRGIPPEAPFARAVAEVIDAWAERTGIAYEAPGAGALHGEAATAAASAPAWVRFLLAFDVDFRKRRLHFLVQGQNRLYQMLDDPRLEGLAAAAVDRLKRDFYHCLDVLRRKEQPDLFSAETRDLAQAIFAVAPTLAEARHLRSYAEDFAARNEERIGALVQRLAAEIRLDASTGDIDALLAGLDLAQWPTTARREVLVNYLGFPFWDILTFSVTTWRDVGEFDEVSVDRISPADVRTLREFGTAETLRGLGFAHFAAFLSRTYRENDYLIGRLHGIDRLVDIVCNSAGIDPAGGELDIPALKRRAFEIVLDAEARHLAQSAELIDRLRRAVATVGTAAK